MQLHPCRLRHPKKGSQVRGDTKEVDHQNTTGIHSGQEPKTVRLATICTHPQFKGVVGSHDGVEISSNDID